MAEGKVTVIARIRAKAGRTQRVKEELLKLLAPTRAERSYAMSAFIITRIQVGDYDTWKPMFEQDRPRAREKAKVQRKTGTPHKGMPNHQ